MGAAAALKHAQSTVIVGPHGAVWPFVFRKQPGAFFFDYSPEDDTVVWSSGNVMEVLGMSEQSVAAHGALFLAHVHPDDRFRLVSLIEPALAGESPLIATYRWIRPDTNEVRLLHCRGMLEPDRSALRGFLVDMTTEAPVLRSEGDLLETIGFSLDHAGLSAMTLDLEYRIRTITSSGTPESFSLGLEDLNPTKVVPGAFFPTCFQHARSREIVTSYLDRAIADGGAQFEIESPGRRTVVRPINHQDSLQGLIVTIFDVRSEQRALADLHDARAKLESMTRSSSAATLLLDQLQEAIGYASIISRNTHSNPLVRHAADALLRAAQSSGDLALTIVDPDRAPPRPRDAGGANRNVDHRAAGGSTVLIAARDNSPLRILASLLKDAGVHAATAGFSEDEIREVLVRFKFIRLLIIDVGDALPLGAGLVRRLRKYFPAVHIICLASASTSQFGELQRAGATSVLSKPVQPRELEQVIRALLNVSALTR